MPLLGLSRAYCRLALLLLALAPIYIANLWLQGFQFVNDHGQLRLPALVLGAWPILLFGLAVVYFLRTWAALVLVSFLMVLLSLGNRAKETLSGHPLYAAELTDPNALSIAVEYAPTSLLFATAGLFFVFVILVLRDLPSDRSLILRQGPRRHIAVVLVVAGALFVALRAVPIEGSPLEDPTGIVTTKLRILLERVRGDAIYDVRMNVRTSGLYMHLVQVGEPEIPPPPTMEELELARSMVAQLPDVEGPRHNVVLVLCESCWHGGGRFSEAFEPLREAGGEEFRLVSSEYGGGTVNVTFEMLTGLPAGNVLDGVIFQRYVGTLRTELDTVVSDLRSSGYRTVHMHNYRRSFWNRSLVLPRFGFDDFHGIEDMADVDSSMLSIDWPDDRMLFDHAQEYLRDLPAGDRFFMYLATVATHGPYESGDDLGGSAYGDKLTLTIAQLAEFVTAIRELTPDTIIAVFGDHRPALNEYFVADGTFDDAGPGLTQLSNRIRGDVPAFVFHPSRQAARRIASDSDRMPFFCFSSRFFTPMLEVSPPALAHGNKVCDEYPELTDRETRSLYPPWLYSMQLFETEGTEE